MSFRKERFLNYKGSEQFKTSLFAQEKPVEDVRNLFLEVLYGGISGFCFSVYEEGQKPGTIIPEAQVRRRMQILSKYTGAVRSFSCIEGNELIPKIAKEFGMKTLVGAWLGSDEEKNREEIAGLIQLAKEGYVDYAAVGNEVLYRKDLSEKQLLFYINHVKQQIPGIPVGYVDAYYEFTHRPAIADACDMILCNCYPYWEGTAFEHSFEHLQQMYHQAVEAGQGKKVIITETGWPSEGRALGDAEASHLNAMKYFVNANLWAMDENVDIFYFASFDESWKTGTEGDVGAHWGIWDKSEKLKFIDEHI